MNPPDGANRSFSPVEMNEMMGRIRFAIPFIALFFGLIVAAVVFFVIWSETDSIHFALGIAFAIVIAQLVGFVVLWRSIESRIANVTKRLEEHAAGIGPDGARDEPLQAEAIRWRAATPTDHSIIDREDTYRSLGIAAGIAIAIFLVFGIFFGFAVSSGIDTIGGVGFGVILLVFLLIGLFALRQRLRILSAFRAGQIHISRLPVRLDESFEIHFERRLRRFFPIREVTASLKCIESASYSHGTNRVTATEIVRSVVLPFPISISPHDPVLRGAWRVTLPAGGPASFTASNNKIEWKLELMITPEAGVADDSVFAIKVAPEVVS